MTQAKQGNGFDPSAKAGQDKPVSVLMSMPARQRLTEILEQENAEDLVARLSVHDFYFTVKEVGAEDATPLLSLAKVEQLDHLFGLEWWLKDRVQPARALEWLSLLDRVGRGRLLAWLCHADFELLVALFKKWIRVALAPEDVDPLEAREILPRNTLDDQYYWDAAYPQYEDLLERMLSLLFEVHSGFYRELLNHVIWASEAQMEEEAHRFNRGRLEDEGIPDFHEALGIYQSVDERALRQDGTVPPRKHADGIQPPLFTVALIPPRDTLGTALEKLGDEGLMEALRVELAALANKVVIADGLSLETPEALRGAMEKVSAYVSIGLEAMSAGYGDVAGGILGSVYLERLFQLGYAKVARVRKRFREILRTGWLSRWPTGIGCLDPEWVEAGELLLLKAPKISRRVPGADLGEDKPDHFRSMDDLHRAEEWVEMIAAVGRLYDVLNPQPERLESSIWPHGVVGRLEDVTLAGMVWTACGNSILRGEWDVEPISLKQWPHLFPRATPEMVRAALHSWIDAQMHSSLNRSRVEAYMQPVFNAYEREMGEFLTEGRLPDPELVRFFIFGNVQ